MSEPKRIQRKRTKGWRKPKNTVIVDRTSRWGNPFKIGYSSILGKTLDRSDVIAAHIEWLDRDIVSSGLSNRDYFAPLRGKDLACTCPLDLPCHADILLELANQ